jgi:hypothetical protein
MTRVADFVSIQDHGTKMGGDADGNFAQFSFDAPGAQFAPSLLAFRVKTEGEVRLQAELNGRNLFSIELEPGSERSFHEVISTDIVREQGNDMEIAINGSGQAVVSDVVLLYHRNVAPVAAG